MAPFLDDTVYQFFQPILVPVTWKLLFERIESDSDIDETKKEKWRAAIYFLKTEMGKDFSPNCGIHHPVKIKLTNAPWLLDDLLHFVNTLQQLKISDSNYPLLLSKLRSRRLCRSEGMFLVEIAGYFLPHGFHTYFIPERDQKTADLLLTDLATKDTFYLEVTQIDYSTERRQAIQEHAILSNAFLQQGFDLPHSCQQLQHIDRKEMQRIVEKIKAMKDEAYLHKSFISFRNEYVDIALAHPCQAKVYTQWCQENKIKNGINGLQLDFNNTRRIIDHSKIHNKVKQLPNHSTGLLYMPVHYMYFFTMDKALAILSLAKEMQSYPHLMGIVLYANLEQPMPEKTVSLQEHAVSIKMINGLARHTLFVFNHAYNGTLAPETIQRIKNSIY